MACIWTLTLTLLAVISMTHRAQALHLYRTLEDLDIERILADIENTDAGGDHVAESTTAIPVTEITRTTADNLDNYAEALFEALYSSLSDIDSDDNKPESLSTVDAPSLQDVYRNSLASYNHQSLGSIKSSSRLFKHWRLQNRRNQNPHLYTNI